MDRGGKSRVSPEKAEKEPPEKLVEKAAEGDSGAFSELCVRYDGLLRSKAASFSQTTGHSAEDLYQEALLAFYSAVRSFDTGNGKVTFGLYASHCVTNALISVYRKENSKKRKKNTGDDRRSGNEQSGRSYSRLPSLPDDPEGYITRLEYDVLILFSEGKSYDEIAEKGYTLVPSRYIEFVNRDENIDFDTKMATLQAELKDLLVAEEKSKADLLNVFKGLGYEIEL